MDFSLSYILCAAVHFSLTHSKERGNDFFHELLPFPRSRLMAYAISPSSNVYPGIDLTTQIRGGDSLR